MVLQHPVQSRLSHDPVLAGMPLVQLLEKAFPTILGIVFPYCETQDAADKELAQDVLHNGIFPEQLGGEALPTELQLVLFAQAAKCAAWP